MMLAVDLSNYTSPLTPTNLAALKTAGVGLAIVQAVDPPPGYPAGVTRSQVQACLDAGLTVDVYVWLWMDLDVSDITRKLHLIAGLDIHQLFLDVEDTAAVKYDQATCEAKVQAALDECDAIGINEPTGIYTGRWFWTDPRYMGNTTAFADRELWDANYDDVADAALGFVPYGGWAAPRIKQFRGTSSLGGISGLDLNVLSVDEAAELEPSAPTPEPLPVPAEPQCDWPWVAKKSAVVTQAGELVAVADQLVSAGKRKHGPLRDDVLSLAEAVRARAQKILA